jgi:hypothetical protein
MDITIRLDYLGLNFFMKDDVAELVPSYPKHSLQEITKRKKEKQGIRIFFSLPL